MIALLILVAAGTLLAALPCAGQPFSVIEATIPEMQAAMAQHRLTSRELVLQYLVRIAIYEDKLHAAITVNPHALAEADARRRELRATGARDRVGRKGKRTGMGGGAY